MSRWLVGGLAVVLSGCSAPKETNDWLPATDFSPALGPRQTFIGVWSLGFEMSKFTYCADGAENCRIAMFDRGGCWLHSTGERPGQIEKMIGGMPKDDDKLYVKFEGRETLKRGQFGHLGMYSCEIHGEKLISAERIAPDLPEKAR